jgi:Na+/melibiose symporter-like transporter
MGSNATLNIYMEVPMNAGRIIAYIGAAILIIFGFLFILATFGPQGQLGWLLFGGILLIAGFALIWFASRKPPQETPVNVTYKVDLSGDVNLETIKCKSCGGTLSPDNVKMVAGAPVVSCPYCGTTYQLTEEPKW